MFNPIKFFTTPEYLFHPAQAIRRLRRFWHRRQPVEQFTLPWGARLAAHTDENIGIGIYYYGIFDKVVPEAIFRLLDQGEQGLEIGANIGQNCSCMARRVGPGGRVLAFEPHPEIAGELRKNAAAWGPPRFGPVTIHEVALSAEAGEAFLDLGAEFDTNRGSASLQPQAAGGARGFKVRMARLDDYLDGAGLIGVCKIDVEGHELGVLRGASAALARRAIRDIIFEDFAPQPGAVAKLLQDHGYTVFRLGESRFKPVLSSLETPEARGSTHNFLATLDPKRAQGRFAKPGWRCLMNW